MSTIIEKPKTLNVKLKLNTPIEKSVKSSIHHLNFFLNANT